MPLMPKRVKYRKQQRGSRSGLATTNTELSQGDFGLKAMEPPPPAPGPKVAQAAGAPAPDSYAAIRPVLEQRCYSCHGEAVQMKNVRLDSPAALKTHAQAVYQQVAVLKQMPMSNATGITEAERVQIGEWFKAGAKTE